MAGQTKSLPHWVILILIAALAFFLKLMMNVLIQHGGRLDLIDVNQGRHDERLDDHDDEIERLRDGK